MVFSGSPILPSSRSIEDNKIEEIMNGPVKEALGLNRTFGLLSSEVFSALREDFMKPATEIGLLNNV